MKTGFLDMKTRRHDFFVDCMLWDKLRRLWRLAIATHPRTARYCLFRYETVFLSVRSEINTVFLRCFEIFL